MPAMVDEVDDLMGQHWALWTRRLTAIVGALGGEWIPQVVQDRGNRIAARLIVDFSATAISSQRVGEGCSNLTGYLELMLICPRHGATRWTE